MGRKWNFISFVLRGISGILGFLRMGCERGGRRGRKVGVSGAGGECQGNYYEAPPS